MKNVLRMTWASVQNVSGNAIFLKKGGTQKLLLLFYQGIILKQYLMVQIQIWRDSHGPPRHIFAPDQIS
ncbi:hypothetical protein [Komagataeibacter swingsii]|uniref:Uncharacterized protein n=1 Tax=Komagataeibacter swingsii TaxID=215220 RepID=A0A850P361_9PROT|nr:hypothetical protein [Komagataeibacter swingsii]NVN36162.1 hypothetical protein [Komagataeibacter swingsii]